MRTTGALAGALVLVLSPAVASGAARGAPALCRLARFAISLGPPIGEATGQHTLALRLVNRGGGTCLLDGYPRVWLYDAAGPIPFVISHAGDQMISPRRPRPVLVRPGGAAFVVLNKYRCDTHSERATTRIELGSAGGSVSIVFSVPYRILLPYRIPDYCGKGDPGSIVTVSPFAATVRAALGG